MLTLCSNTFRKNPCQFSQARFAGKLCLEGVPLVDPRSFKDFHDLVSKVFDSEEGYVAFANQVLSDKGREQFMEGVNKGELPLKMTICSMTTRLIKEIALKTVFKNPDRSLDALAPVGSLQEVNAEMKINRLALYGFCLSKASYNHVFSIMKWPTTDHDPVFVLYQSHIQAYTLKTFMSSQQYKIYRHHEVAAQLKPFIDISDEESVWTKDHYDAFRKFSQYDLWDNDRQLRYTYAPSKMKWRSIHEKGGRE